MSEHNLKPMSQVMNSIKKEGFTKDFIFRGGFLQEMESGKTYEASKITIVKDYRFEGESNPDDLSILYAIHTDDGLKGCVSNGYGVNANDELEEFIKSANWMV